MRVTTTNPSILFSIAALFNVAIAAFLLFAPGGAHELMVPGPEPQNFLLTYLLAVLVGTFGLGYWWVARDPQRNLSVIQLAIIGKTLVFIVVAVLFFQNGATAFILALATADLVFAALFLRAAQSLRPVAHDQKETHP